MPKVKKEERGILKEEFLKELIKENGIEDIKDLNEFLDELSKKDDRSNIKGRNGKSSWIFKV